MKTDGPIIVQSKAFALRIVKMYRWLVDERHELVMSKQVLRSGTSIGANIAEAKYAASKADFINKYSIALKETSETLYWLELLQDSNYLDSTSSTVSLVNECNSLENAIRCHLHRQRA